MLHKGFQKQLFSLNNWQNIEYVSNKTSLPSLHSLVPGLKYEQRDRDHLNVLSVRKVIHLVRGS